MNRACKRRTIYAGKVLDVALEEHCLPNGRQAAFEIIRHPGGAAVLPVLPDGRLLLIRQFRPAVDALVYEIPAGRIEPDETARSCAERELAEEAGYRAGHIEDLGGMYSAVGFCDEYIALFLATELQPVGQELEPDEIIELCPMTADQVFAKLAAGEIPDGKTQLALHNYQRRISGGP